MSNQKINSEILPSNLKNINWNYDCVPIEHHIKIVNNIRRHHHVIILLKIDIFGIDGPKWPIHVIDYREHKWSQEIYEIQDTYI